MRELTFDEVEAVSGASSMTDAASFVGLSSGAGAAGGALATSTVAGAAVGAAAGAAVGFAAAIGWAIGSVAYETFSYYYY